ncbi:hypothetical protein HFC70_10695 [Agrobacterium sp. a22-2]|uniref:hypothetical protein n=1 Tax=Agrobacterium sp. a22-2 TaxID=2283840 RepID=UPI0014480EF0|nr:hypothetical protein [Agrobacterium sp. a22-2]NKN36821.1 hypothetical protein [Agrobacterium sp. a22-2]
MSDKAERLHQLIGRIQEAAQQATLKENGQTVALSKVALWQSFNPISANLGYADYGEFLDAFLALCHSIKSDISVIPMQKETVRASWLACIKNISSVFDAKNFGKVTRDAFGSHFSERNLELLDAISERFQAAKFTESTPDDLQDALDAVRETVEAFKSSDKLDRRIAALLSHYLQQMESAYSHVCDFGDDTFWKLYKETFATFMQLHPVITEMENAEEIKSKLKVVADRLTSKSVAGISLTANVATIGSTLFQMLIA